MAKANSTWKVLPHGPLTALDAGLWRVEGNLEGMPLKRVMTIARRSDGLLVIHSAMALEESTMKEIESHGTVGFVVVPNGFHRLDAPLFKERYANAKIVCPAGSRKKVEEVVPVDLVYEEFPHDEVVELRTLKGIKESEGVMIVRSPDATTLVFTDALFNMPHLPGFQGFILKHLAQSSGGLRVSRLFKIVGLKDKKAFAADLIDLAKLPKLRRVVVAHHETFEGNVSETLTRIAGELQG